MRSLLLDLKFVLRQLRKSPGFTATAVLMLALGVGATTAIFSIVEGVLLRPLPFPDPDRLMVLADRITGADVGGNGEAGVTVPDIRTYTRDTHGFAALGGYQFSSYELSSTGEPAFINASRLTAGVFSALAVQPHLGRVFTPDEDEHSQPVAVLSYTTWQERFHGDPQILGTKILLDRKPYVVIGVMPRNFEFPLVPGQMARSELWVPMSFTPRELATQSAANWSWQMVGRLKPGISPAQAQEDAQRVAQQIMRNYPAFMASLHISSVVRPLQEETVEQARPCCGPVPRVAAGQAQEDAQRVAQQIMRNYPAYMASLHISSVVRPLQEETVEQARPLLRTLFLAVGVVLLIACVNLASLMLVRAIRRQREFALRLALGARAMALLRQAILESLVLSLSGGMLGLALAALALRVGKNLLPESLPRLNEIALNWQVVGFALLLGVITGLLCGSVPAFAALRTNVNGNLKEGGRAGNHGRSPRTFALDVGGGRDRDRPGTAHRLGVAAAQL